MSEQPSASLATFAGAAGGGANIFTGFPFDTVKVRLQASPRGLFDGPLSCARHILCGEGVRGLYRGLSVPLVGGVVETGINYAVFTQAVALMEGTGAIPQTSSIPTVAASAALAGFTLSFFLSPAELVKCRMQMGASAGFAFAGPIHCIRHLVQTEGLRGLSRGLSGTLARETFGNSVFFVLYEALRRKLPGRQAQQQSERQILGLGAIVADSAGAIVCGGLAGMGMWAAVLPIDVAKSRMQVARPGTPYDVSLWRNMQLLYAARGLRGGYIGLGPTLVRAFPANAAQW